MATETQTAFFSYSHEDSDFAFRPAKDLKAAGANVWMDKLDIEPGMPWDVEVEKALANCPRMLVILSPSSVNSKHVGDEVSFALEKQKRVIPILCRECDVPFRLARLQHIDFKADYSNGLMTLMKTLSVERPEPSIPSPSTVPKVSQGLAHNALVGVLPMRGMWQKKRIRAIMILLGMLACSILAYLIFARPSVYSAFRAAYQLHKAKRGEPTSRWQDSGSMAYEAKQDNATVVWLERDRNYYALPDNPKTKVVKEFDPTWGVTASEKPLGDIKELRKKFNCPLDRNPPRLGLASHWLNNPKNWEWMGWGHWDCIFWFDDAKKIYDAKKIFYQSFEHGKIIGPLRTNGPSDKDSPLFVAVIFDDESWIPESVEGIAQVALGVHGLCRSRNESLAKLFRAYGALSA